MSRAQDRYEDALRGVRAWERAIAEGGSTPARETALTKARIDMKNARALCRGGEIARAERAVPLGRG